MRIAIDVNLHYRFPQPNTAFLAIEAARVPGQTITEECLDLGDATLYRIAGDAGVGERIWARLPGQELKLTYRATVEITRPTPGLEQMEAAPLYSIPAEAAPYLRPSRYCQSDRFVAFVARRFGHLPGGARIVAMRDWIEHELTYRPGSSDANTTVLETFAGREGVCRDYAHLLCTFARASGIPSRCVAVYGPDVSPMDFHAVVQVWLEDGWHLIDATGMGRAEELAVIAVGRDAYDIAFLDSEVPAELVGQQVRVTRV